MAEHHTGEVPVVSVVLPIRNEQDFITGCLRAVLAQDYPAARMEVIVVDGASDDATPRIAASILSQSGIDHAVISNDRRTVPISMNLGIAAAKGDVVVRVDGHCEIAQDYVRRCVEVLAATGAGCVGGICETVSAGLSGEAIALAQSSPFGVGNVAFRTGRPTAGAADTVPFGAFPTALLRSIGGYDEELVRNQDDELTFRLAQAGHVVWYDPTIRSKYYSRADLAGLWRQYFQYGLYKVRVMQKRGGLAAPRQAVPAVFVSSLTLGVLASITTRRVRWAALPAAPYAVATIAVGWRTARGNNALWPRVAAAFCMLHVGYGSGFLAGLWKWRRHFGAAR